MVGQESFIQGIAVEWGKNNFFLEVSVYELGGVLQRFVQDFLKGNVA